MPIKMFEQLLKELRWAAASRSARIEAIRSISNNAHGTTERAVKRLAAFICLAFLLCGSVNARETLSEEEKGLLCQNDLFNAKNIIAYDSVVQYPLARAFLKRAQDCDTSGEVEFYTAVLGVRQTLFTSKSVEFGKLINEASRLKEPFAMALQYEAESPDDQTAAQRYEENLEQERQRNNAKEYPDFKMAFRIASKFLQQQ